ncbi:MAG: metallophosphoesterase family protein [Candidatus Bipolaricaulota bacterium]
MSLIETARRAMAVIRKEERVIRLPEDRRIVYVGDTHGDLEAVETVIREFGDPEHVVVFLGDTVDRGPASASTLERVLAQKIARPASTFLLCGNHEAYGAVRFRIADFWESLEPHVAAELADLLLGLPLAAWHPARVLAVHGALPDSPTLDTIASLAPGESAWRDVVWGDWRQPGEELPYVTGRPQLGPEEFRIRSATLGVRVLVRSHQPDAPTYLFGDRCLTVFTSSAYGGLRRVAVLSPGRPVNTARDLELLPV